MNIVSLSHLLVSLFSIPHARITLHISLPLRIFVARVSKLCCEYLWISNHPHTFQYVTKEFDVNNWKCVYLFCKSVYITVNK